MNLSRSTVDILKNFCNINQSILFKPGNIISTRSIDRTIVAQAEVLDNFPIEFAIYDLPKLISTLSLFSHADIEFLENNLLIKEEEQQVTYVYTNPQDIMAATYKQFSLDMDPIVFSLNETTLTTALKAASILQVPELTFEGRDEEIFIAAQDARVQSANRFSKVTTKGKGKNFSFKVRVKIENFKLAPNNYLVKLYGDKVLQFSTTYEDKSAPDKQIKLDYWFALQQS